MKCNAYFKINLWGFFSLDHKENSYNHQVFNISCQLCLALKGGEPGCSNLQNGFISQVLHRLI